jgi:hypothetical protein
VRTEELAGPAGPAPGAGEPADGNHRPGRRVTIVVLVITGIIAALWVFGPSLIGPKDDPTAIDSKPVRTAVSAACTQLRADLAALPAGLHTADRAEAENRAVERLIASVRAVGPDALAHDDPTEQWLGDWEQIVAARRQAVRDGRPFATPAAHGAPVNIRMFELIRSGLEQCDVPRQLLTPQPGSS